MSEDEWNAILDTNLTGTLRACQVFGRHMLERGYGRIVNIASLPSFVGLFEVAAYTASKAGVAALTQVARARVGPARRERQRHRARRLPHAAQPGPARRHANAARSSCSAPRSRRFGRVEELAGAAVFLASDAASFVNGEVLVVDGGFLASGVNQ